MNFSIPQLQYIVALDNFRNFSEAARFCHVTQPTLSMQVKKMEEELSVVVFDRSKKPLRPTAIGALVIEKARIILDGVLSLKGIASEDNKELQGVLKIGIIPTVAPYLVPLFAGNFLRKYPKTELKIIELKTDDIITGLKKEILDVGILATPTHAIGIHEQPLYYEKMLAFVSKSIASIKKNRLEISEILDHKLWMLSEGNCFRNQVFNLCALDQVDFKDLALRYESGSIESLMRLVDREGGLTLVPELASIMADGEKLDQFRFVDEVNPVREISIVTGRRILKKQLIKALSNQVTEDLPQQIVENNSQHVVEIN